MVVNRGKQYSDVEQTPKSGLSSDCRLQPACMKSELLVIADQHAAVNTFPGLVHTALWRTEQMKQAVLTSKVRGITENSLLFNFEGPQSLRRQLKMDNGKWKVKIN